MPNCLSCNYSYPPMELSNGSCKECLLPELVQKHQEELDEEQRLKEIEIEKYNSILLTEEITIEKEIEPIELISSKCIYGIDKKKQFLSNILDMIVGNMKASENTIKDAKDKVMNDFKKQAYSLGGDAVVAIKTEHIHSNARNMHISMTGTVVKLKEL